ncbi:MAG: hypothetical protein ACR2HF_09825 [Methylococcaceae bacterium]
MRQRWVAALALPLSAAQCQQVCAVRAVDLQRHRRNKGAGITIASLAATSPSVSGK